jgi:hypothetical protein
MNTSDWIAATGTAYTGMGAFWRRPVNPKLLPHLVAKGRPAKPSALTRQTRRMILQVAQLTGKVDAMLTSAAAQRRRARAAVRDTSIYAQSVPGAAGARAQLQHWAAVQRARDRR